MRELWDWWDRWGPSLMIAVVAVGFLRVVWGREAFCGPETEQCLREWVSALGGWVAVAAAIPTVIFLSKQISAADRHHRTATAVELRRTSALARQVIIDAEMIEFIADLNRPGSTWPSSKAEVEIILKTYDEYLVDRFADIEAELGSPKKHQSLSSLRSKTALIKRVVLDHNFDKVKAVKLLNELSDELEAYASAITSMAQRFIDDPAAFWDRKRR